MFRFIWSLLGFGSQGTVSEPPRACYETLGPYCGHPIPIAASRTEEDSRTWYGDFFGQLYIAPHNDGKSVLVFPRFFQSETSTGRVIWDVWYTYYRRDDEDDPRECAEAAIKVYKHLGFPLISHPRVVRLLGRTSSGYRLERLRPGPMPLNVPTASSDEIFLALYQRWALQALSALTFLHDAGVMLKVFSNHTTWLRQDLSIAVASLVTARCTELQIAAGSWGSGEAMYSQWCHWDERSQYPRSSHDEEGADIKNELFNWATWVFGLMTGGKHPLEHDRDEGSLRLNASGLFLDRCKSVEKGTYDDFPLLEDRLLGNVVMRAWKGGCSSSREVAQDVKAVLQQMCERKVVGEYEDELDGYNWAKLIEVSTDDIGRNRGLRLRKLEVLT